MNHIIQSEGTFGVMKKTADYRKKQQKEDVVK